MEKCQRLTAIKLWFFRIKLDGAVESFQRTLIVLGFEEVDTEVVLCISIVLSEFTRLQEIFDGVLYLANLTVAESTVHERIELLTCLEVLDGVAVLLDGCRDLPEKPASICQVVKGRPIGTVAYINGLLEQSICFLDKEYLTGTDFNFASSECI